MAIGLLYGMVPNWPEPSCSRFTVGVTIAAVMTASDDQRSAVHVLSYVRPNQTPLERKYANPAARRSLHLAVILVAYLLLMPVLLPGVDLLAQRNRIAGAALAVTVLAAWVGISLSAVVFGVIGFIRSTQRNVR